MHPLLRASQHLVLWSFEWRCLLYMLIFHFINLNRRENWSMCFTLCNWNQLDLKGLNFGWIVHKSFPQMGDLYSHLNILPCFAGPSWSASIGALPGDLLMALLVTPWQGFPQQLEMLLMLSSLHLICCLPHPLVLITSDVKGASTFIPSPEPFVENIFSPSPLISWIAWFNILMCRKKTRQSPLGIMKKEMMRYMPP